MIIIKSINTSFENTKKEIGNLLNIKINGKPKNKPQEFTISPERQQEFDAEKVQRWGTPPRKYPWLDSKTSPYIDNIEKRLESLGNPSGLTMKQREANLNKRLRLNSLKSLPLNKLDKPKPLNQKEQNDIQAAIMRIHEAIENERKLKKKEPESIDDILMR
jgi:hypothetical protein